MSKQDKAYVITVDMGYGHQRAAHPLKDIATCPPDWKGDSTIIPANNYAGVPKKDQKKWKKSRKIYETVSRMKSIPLIGDKIFEAMDFFQQIEPFYPKRDMSQSNMQLRQIYKMIRKGWGKHLIDTLNHDPKPYITTFFTTAFFAEEHGYEGEIYCLCTDTDISRAWAPLKPQETCINYLAPTRRVRERLKLYGVPADQIYTTGFPLPEENIGDKDTFQELKKSLSCRIANLDSKGKYFDRYEKTIDHYLGDPFCDSESDHPLTITFTVGGAGAQRKIGTTILNSLHSLIDKQEVRLNLVAGSRNDVYRFYEKKLSDLELEEAHGNMLNIIYDPNKQHYFKKFNEILKTTDILWTKPSELSFYSALGIPVIMAPPIGSQEEYNREWLLSIGAGFDQKDPEYTDQWLFDWIESGWLAEAAMEGFLDAPISGVFNIKNIVLGGEVREIEEKHLL